jgi:manganese transport protein
LLGRESDDFETVTDKERMQQYVQRLKEKGYAATGHIGFRDRAREIVRIVKETDADMLVIGGHRHSGVKDWIYGETINSVRHELTIPVLVVNF